MKVYLDTCSLQRPLDSKDQVRVALEAEAVLVILALCETGLLDLISSEALLFESSRNTNLSRKEYALEVLRKAKLFVEVDDEIKDRAQQIIRAGIMPLDALHLALAEKAEADYLCTCDDRFLKKARTVCQSAMRIVSPVQLLEEIEI